MSHLFLTTRRDARALMPQLPAGLLLFGAYAAGYAWIFTEAASPLCVRCRCCCYR